MTWSRMDRPRRLVLSIPDAISICGSFWTATSLAAFIGDWWQQQCERDEKYGSFP